MNKKLKFGIILTILIIIILTLLYFIKKNWYYDNYIPKKLKIIQTKHTDTHHDTDNKKQIKVWTYWEGKPNQLVDLCLDRIEKSCKMGSCEKYIYTHIHIANRTDIEKYIEINENVCDSSSPAHLKSDIIRLSLLKKYGGIWLDSSSFILTPINKLFFNKYINRHNCFQAYYNPRNSKLNSNYPVIETSVMYSPPNHPFIVDWLDEMNSIINCDPKTRENYAKNTKLYKHLNHLDNTYHFVYFACMNVLYKHKGINFYNNINLYNVIDTKFFAFLSFDLNDFTKLTTEKFIDKYNLKYCRLVKFIKNERDKININLNKSIPNCFIKSAPIDIKSLTISKFKLRNIAGDIIKNTDYEFEEQKLLHQYLEEGDNLLQLGGNIGTSCLLADKTANLKNNYCVEPSNKVIKTLKHNTSNSNVNVIHGIIAENCSNKSLNDNDHIGAQIENNKDGQSVKCTSLYDIEPKNGFNVIFADCEGCFDDFIKTYQHRLKQYPIDTIIYERDATDKINYENVDKFMKDNNFNCSGDFWKVCTH